MKFDEEYYKEVIKKYNYNPLLFNKIDFQLPGISKNEMQLMWLCSYHSLKNRKVNCENTLFTTGIGLSGVPHMGTISQIIRAIKLQRGGNKVQIVLGDIDAYTGRHISWTQTQHLKEKYRNFILKLGFNSQTGILRAQSDKSVFLTQAKIAGYFKDEIADESEEDLHDLYVKDNKVESKMTFNRKYSLSLMCADFIEPLLMDNFTNIVVFLGLDEHKYVRASKQVMDLMKQEFKVLDSKKIYALYSPLIRGFNGFPKMSKSFTESSLSIQNTPFEIEHKIMNKKEDEMPLQLNVNYQLMKGLMDISEEKAKQVYSDYKNQNVGWIVDKEELLKRVIEIRDMWYE